MMTTITIITALFFSCLPYNIYSFSIVSSSTLKPRLYAQQSTHYSSINSQNDVDDSSHQHDEHQLTTTSTVEQITTRRTLLQQSLLATSILTSTTAQLTSSSMANAAIGTLPEFSDTNAILQSITIDVTDKTQYDETIDFFTKSFDGCKVLRQRNNSGGGVKDTVCYIIYFMMFYAI